jgi:hypothetical protein
MEPPRDQGLRIKEINWNLLFDFKSGLNYTPRSSFLPLEKHPEHEHHEDVTLAASSASGQLQNPYLLRVVSVMAFHEKAGQSQGIGFGIVDHALLSSRVHCRRPAPLP